MYFVYFLRSVINPDKTYIGSTENLVKRLQEHNLGFGIHTNKHKPWKIEAVVLANTREIAETAEAYFKNSSGKEKFKRFADKNPDHPNPIMGFFELQPKGRKFGHSSFKIDGQAIILTSGS